MLLIDEKWVYINMNARSKNVGDCVARALSLAYNMDYNATKKELLALRKELGYDSWKYRQVWSKFIENHEGDGRQDAITPTSKTSVEELASQNPKGTIVVLCRSNKPKEKDTHLVTIIDGNIYDSWDSSKWIVKNYWNVTTNAITNPDMDTDEYIDYTEECVVKYIKQFSEKYKIDYRYDPVRVRSSKGYELKAHTLYAYEIPDGEDGYQEFDIPYKLSPSNTDEKNRQIIDGVSKQWVRWYIKKIAKHIADVLEYRDLHSEYQDKFHGSWNDEQLRKQLPFWCQKLVTYIDEYSKNTDYYKYNVGMQPLIGDPNDDRVEFHADTWTELLQQLQWYKDDYSRYGYDY